MKTTAWLCFLSEKKVQDKAKCRDCDWTRNEPFGTLDAVKEHVNKTGHTVDRTLKSQTVYAPEKEIEVEEAPRRRAWCIDCDKEIGEKARNIVVFWAATSHRKKTGHKLEIIEPDGSRRPL